MADELVDDERNFMTSFARLQCELKRPRKNEMTKLAAVWWSRDDGGAGQAIVVTFCFYDNFTENAPEYVTDLKQQAVDSGLVIVAESFWSQNPCRL